MDDGRFDALARSFGTAHSRRGFGRLLSGLASGAVLAALGGGEATAGSRSGGASCKKGRQCLTRRCVGPKGQKQCTCSEKYPFCKQPANPCQEATCDLTSQLCVTATRPNGDHCDSNRPEFTCSGGVCAEEPSCAGSGEFCVGNSSCCSENCSPYVTGTICNCSAVGQPCDHTDDDQCCRRNGDEVPCIGYYCGGCRGEGQPCDEPGVGCCERFLCNGSTCERPTIGG